MTLANTSPPLPPWQSQAPPRLRADGPQPDVPQRAPEAAASSDASLEALMSRYARGDDDAFVQIHARTGARLLAFLTLLTGDRSRAEDLCQTSYLKLHRTRERYIDGARPLPYLMAIARNTFLDEARSRKRARVRVTSSGQLPETVDPASMRPAAGELQRAIARAVAKLSPLQREAFVLTKLRGLSPREAAEQLGASEVAVKLRVHRAYLALRKTLVEFREDAG